MKSDSLNHSLARFKSNIRIQIQMSIETMIYHLHVAEVAADADADAIKLNPPFNQTSSSIHQRPSIHLPIPIRSVRIVIQSLWHTATAFESVSFVYKISFRWFRYTLSLAFMKNKIHNVAFFYLIYLFSRGECGTDVKYEIKLNENENWKETNIWGSCVLTEPPNSHLR